MPDYQSLPLNRAHLLDNQTCCYCGKPFSDALPASAEHVIARSFVPKGSLNAAFNLILNACEPCNNVKSDLEDDLSAISMHPDTLGRMPSEDERLHRDAARKAKGSISRRTRKPVGQGQDPWVIKGNMMGIEMTFTMVGPPQADDERLFRLAWFQLQGFFYLLTYKEDIKRGHFFLGEFMPLVAVRKEDWGNPQLAWFEETTKDWLVRVSVITADEHFKLWIRKKEEDGKAWAWAIEWNKNYRLVGFVGEPAELQAERDAVPPLEMQSLYENPDRYLRMRTETPLAPEKDTLFDCDVETEADAPEPVES